MAFGDWTHTEDRRKQNTYGGIGYYRTIKPSQSIDGHNITVVGSEIKNFGDNLEEQWDNIFKKYDVFWTSYFCDPVVAAAIFYHSQKHGAKVIVDVDDNYLDVPESNLLYEQFKRTKKDRAYLNTILSFADAITVSTDPLKERLGEHIERVQGMKKDIYVIPNMNDLKDWDFIPAKKKEDKIVIGYSGSNSHEDDLKMIMPAIKQIMEKHSNVYFETVGVISKDKVKDYFGQKPGKWMDRCSILPATSTFKEYPRYLSDRPWDISIAPLVDTPFTRSKSHIKWMEASMYKIPTVASRVYPYCTDLKGRRTVIHNETGILCRPGEWFDALDNLITNKEERERIGDNAYNFVRENWQYPGDISSVVDKMIKTMFLAD